MKDPLALVRSFDEALKREDIDTAVSMMTDDAVVDFSPSLAGYTGTFEGKDEIRLFLDRFARGYHSEQRDMKVSENKVSAKTHFGDTMFQEIGVDSLEGSVGVTVQDGKIKSLEISLTPESAMAARTAAAYPTTIGP